MYEMSREYRSIHSINDKELGKILYYFNTLHSPSTFLDYGCHLGHLSIELAIRYQIEILAVDTFLSSYNDILFKKEGDFKAMFESNVKEACDNCQMLGNITMLSPTELFSKERHHGRGFYRFLSQGRGCGRIPADWKDDCEGWNYWRA